MVPQQLKKLEHRIVRGYTCQQHKAWREKVLSPWLVTTHKPIRELRSKRKNDRRNSQTGRKRKEREGGREDRCLSRAGAGGTGHTHTHTDSGRWVGGWVERTPVLRTLSVSVTAQEEEREGGGVDEAFKEVNPQEEREIEGER